MKNRQEDFVNALVNDLPAGYGLVIENSKYVQDVMVMTSTQHDLRE